MYDRSESTYLALRLDPGHGLRHRQAPLARGFGRRRGRRRSHRGDCPDDRRSLPPPSWHLRNRRRPRRDERRWLMNCRGKSRVGGQRRSFDLDRESHVASYYVARDCRSRLIDR